MSYRIAAVLLGLAPLACRSPSAPDPFPQDVIIPGATTELSVQVDGRERTYLLHEPHTHASTKNPLPLVILLHGSSQQGVDVRAASNMDSLADARRFVVAYPNGVGNPPDWNAGDCCGDPRDQDVDDIGFIESLISSLAKRLPIDRHRIFVGGFSDGARMAYRTACQMADQIAAVAIVSGSLVTENCVPARPVPVIAFHGTDDPSVGYLEPAATAPPRPVPTEARLLPPSIGFWMAANSCTHSASVSVTLHAVRTTATGCAAPVIFYAIIGGQHAWPALGPDYEFSASPIIAAFFAAHRMP